MFFNLEFLSEFRSRLMFSLAGFGLFSFFLGSYTIGSSYFSVSGYGDWSVAGHEMVTWLCLLGIILMAVCSLGLFARKTRCSAAAAMIGCGLMVGVGLVSLLSAENIRMRGFERLAVETAPLVAAIHAYDKTYGHPPENLELLEFTYPEGHDIKGGGLPEFKYLQGEAARKRYHGNLWVLMLETPTGPMRWDRFLYYPKQNYPSLAHGGWLEKVGTWAYVHE